MRHVSGWLCWLLLAAPLTWAQDLDQGLVAHYAADEGSGSLLHDRVGGHHGRILGALWVRHGDRVALDFDGLGNYVDCGDPVPLRLSHNSLTLALWVRVNTRGQQYLLTRYGWSLYLDNGGVPHFEARSEANDQWQDLPGKTPVPLGEWAHVAATYDLPAGEWRLYLNGQLDNAAPRTGGFGGIMRSRLALGSWAWTQAHFVNGLMGDLRLYNRALPPEQVAALYRATLAQRDPELKSPARRFSFKLHSFPGAKKLAVDLAFRNLGDPLPEPGAVVTLSHPRLAQPLTQTLTRLGENGRGSLVFAVDQVPAGPCRLEARVTSAGQPVPPVTGETTWQRPDKRPWWLGSQEGFTRSVPRPWTPLKVSETQRGATVACWGREYGFPGLPFPGSIKSGPAELLAGPIRLRWRTTAGAGSWRQGTLKVTSATGPQVVLQATGQDGDLNLTGRTTLEYDGLARVDWTMTPRTATELQELVCEIPLRGAGVQYYYYYPDRSGSWEAHQPGNLPAAGVAMPFNPSLWLGDNDRGLQWFTEHDAHWLPADPKQAVTVRREGDQVILRLHVIGRPVKLDPAGRAQAPGGAAVSKLSYTFGFQATPVKPRTKDAWDLRSTTLFTPVYSAADPGPDGKCELDRLAAYGVKSVSLMDWTDVLCHNQATEPERLRRFVKACHQRGLQVLVYFGFQVSDAAPEFAEWGEEACNWYSDQPYSYESGLDNYPPKACQTVYRTCYSSYWRDFVVAGAARLMDEYGIDGVYLDGTGCPLPCYNHFHGCGVTDAAGQAHPRYNFFHTRDLMQRLYVAITRRNPQGQINLHNSAFMTMPTMSFATSLWDGEQLSTTPGRPFQERMPLDYFRVEFMGHQWGLADEFLEYVLPGTVRQEWGLTLLHDVPTRPYMLEEHFALASGLWKLMDEFGRRDAAWLPYWRNQEVITVSPAEAYVSLYRHPRNGVLAVVYNYGRQAARVTVDLKLDKLGLPPDCRAQDGLTRKLLPLNGGKLELDLDSLDWQTVWVK